MEEKISIIMSAYNAENTIIKAIESVLAQTYKYFELIIVDDCSTDSTADIINNYIIEDSRIKYCKTPQNAGCGGARKYAMQFITGDWITFIDSDDTYNPEILEGLYKACKENNAKLAHCSIVFTYEDSSQSDPIVLQEEVLNKKDAFIKGFTQNAYRTAWNGLSHKSLWKNIEYNDFRCLDDMCLGTQLLINTNKHAIISYIGYNYLQREDSVFHKWNNSELAYHNLAMYLYLDKWERTKGMFTFMTKGLVLKAIQKYLALVDYTDPHQFDRVKDMYPNLNRDLCEFINNRNVI